MNSTTSGSFSLTADAASASIATDLTSASDAPTSDVPTSDAPTSVSSDAPTSVSSDAPSTQTTPTSIEPTSTLPPTSSSIVTSQPPTSTSESIASSTTTFTASSATPSVVLTTSFTSVAPATTTPPLTVFETSTVTRSSAAPSSTTESTGSSTTSQTPLNTGNTNNNSDNGGGLSTGSITAIAVVVPVVVVALLVLAGILLWRKRKQKKAVEEVRRKEVEDYNYNPNNDPTLPAVASESALEMSEGSNAGYRGWGAATSHRKMSTTLSGGHTQGQLSDVGSNAQFGGHSPNARASDGQSTEPLYQQRDTTSGEDGHPHPQAQEAEAAMRRGPSNASSTYSAGAVSDLSEEPTGVLGQPYNAYRPDHGGFGYSQHGPYGDGTYANDGSDPNGMPVVRDVGARRNTRIQAPGNYPQGNSGISQNF